MFVLTPIATEEEKMYSSLTKILNVDLGEGFELSGDLLLGVDQFAGNREEGLLGPGSPAQGHLGAHLCRVPHVQHMHLNNRKKKDILNAVISDPDP